MVLLPSVRAQPSQCVGPRRSLYSCDSHGNTHLARPLPGSEGAMFWILSAIPCQHLPQPHLYFPLYRQSRIPFHKQLRAGPEPGGAAILADLLPPLRTLAVSRSPRAADFCSIRLVLPQQASSFRCSVLLHFTEPFCPPFDKSSRNFICTSPLKQQRPLFRLEAQVSLSHTRESREPLSVGQCFPP
jgi:hypothetical protein